jgi:hypothetical protein
VVQLVVLLLADIAARHFVSLEFAHTHTSHSTLQQQTSTASSDKYLLSLRLLLRRLSLLSLLLLLLRLLLLRLLLLSLSFSLLPCLSLPLLLAPLPSLPLLLCSRSLSLERRSLLSCSKCSVYVEISRYVAAMAISALIAVQRMIP